MKKSEMKLVYKYTSFETFKDILENDSLLLTDIKKSNDRTELKLIYNVLSEVFIEEFNKANPKYMERNFPEKEFRKFYNENTTFINKAETTLHTQYVTCFSSSGDMLSQWRGYGSDGKGISIGFDENWFKYLSHEYCFDKVRYNHKKQKAVVRKNIKTIVRKLRSHVKENGTMEGFSVTQFQTAYNELLLKGVFIKHPFFKEERESRLSYWHTNNLERKNLSIKKNAIKEIIIGPKCTIKKETIEELLDKYNVSCVVKFSAGHGIYVDSENQNKKESK